MKPAAKPSIPMHIDSLQQFFASSPAVRLIRSPHAFWIVDFLHQQFKRSDGITRPHGELVAELEGYLEQLAATREIAADAKNKSQDADAYLTMWCSGSIGWLKRFIDADATEPSYQLTAEFEKALAFVEQASRPVQFVGTESRLRSILAGLGEVVAGVSQDPKLRTARLQAQRDAIDAELAAIDKSPDAGKLSSTQVRERFALASQQLRQLRSEFRTVEDRFKALTRGVQQRVLAASDSRGDILQFALDGEEALKRGDQGQSFFEFLRLLHSPESQDRINVLVAELGKIEAIAADIDDLDAVRTMVPTLLAEAEKILRTTQHLSRALRRLLDSRSTQHHQQLASVLRDVLSSAAELAHKPPANIGIDIEVELEIQCPFDRPFWMATDPFDEVDLQTTSIDATHQAAALEQLVALERIDWTTMRRNVSQLTERAGEVDLPTLLREFPAQGGAVEVLVYLQIAFDDGHRVDRTRQIELPTELSGSLARRLSIPHVVFLPKPQRAKARIPRRGDKKMETRP